MSKKKNDRQPIICPVCSGTGKNKIGLACSNCRGMGLGIFYRGYFFFWSEKLTKIKIELRRAKEKADITLNFAILGFGLLGLVSLIIWIYTTSITSVRLENFAFWRMRHPLIFIFWLSLLVDLFTIYRLVEERLSKKSIKIFKYEETKLDLKVPDNWEALIAKNPKYKIDVINGYEKSALKVVENAFLLTKRLGNAQVMPVHLFFASLSDPQVGAIFARLSTDTKKLINFLKKYIQEQEAGKNPRISNTLKKILIEAYLDASVYGQKKVSTKNFLLPLLKYDNKLKEMLFDLEIDKNKINNVLTWFIVHENLLANYKKFKYQARFKPATSMDRAYTAVATPTLNHYGRDLTIAAKWGYLDYCVARDDDIKNIFQNLVSGNNGIILNGPPGIGKKTIIGGIAQRMVEENVPKMIMDKRLVKLDVARLISGATPAEVEGRMVSIIDEIAKAGNITLFIDNIENIMGITSGQAESLDLSEVLAMALERKQLICYATATRENYRKYIEGKLLGNIMAKIDINEPQGNQAIQIIESKIAPMEQKHNIYFSYNAIAKAIELSSKYIHDSYLPRKAISILENVGVRVTQTKGSGAFIGAEDVAKVVSDITKIPVTKITERESKQLLNLEDRIHERMVNQEEAVKMVSASLRRARTKLREEKRPIASFLFLGPTGVGKTELAKTIANVYFGSEQYIIRVDMSEYQHPDSVKKMIGDSQNTKGYLTEAVRRAPFALILLDEIEKAHSEILNLFLQVMDDGRLTDGSGRTIDFTSAIIIATSNAGSLFIQKQIYAGTDLQKIKETLINDQLAAVMRPELINRFDGIIIFEPLSMDNVIAIARLMLKKVEKMLNNKGIDWHADDRGIAKLAQAGYDPKFGARPLRRVIQNQVENAIANKILAGKLKRRDTVILNENAGIDVEKGATL